MITVEVRTRRRWLKCLALQLGWSWLLELAIRHSRVEYRVAGGEWVDA